MAKIKKISIWKSLTQFLNRKNKIDDDTTLYFIEARTVIETSSPSAIPWYRIYSDGFMMCGGRSTSSTVELPNGKSFINNTFYHVIITPIGTNSAFSYSNNTSSRFTVSGVSSFSWIAFGYTNIS